MFYQDNQWRLVTEWNCPRCLDIKVEILIMGKQGLCVGHSLSAFSLPLANTDSLSLCHILIHSLIINAPTL